MLTFLLVGFFFTGCQMESPALEDLGQVSVSIKESSRSLLPQISLNVASYKIRFEKNGIGTSFVLTNGETADSYTLAEGTYTLSVEGVNASEVVIGRGVTPVTVVAGGTTAASVDVLRLTGTGTLKLEAKVLGLDLVTPNLSAVLVSSADGTSTDLNFTIQDSVFTSLNPNLAPGYYTLTFTLKDGSTEVATPGVEWPFILTGATTYGGISFHKSANGNILSNITMNPPVVTKEDALTVQSPLVSFNPTGGTYNKDQVVQVTMSGEAGSEIRYTTDKTDPSAASSLYSAPFALPTGTVGSYEVRAKAFMSGKLDSPVVTQAFTVTPNDYVVPDTLGALYSPGKTVFRLWSPDSTNVSVSVNAQTVPMTKVADFGGYTDVYEAVVNGDMKNKEYQFKVNNADVRDPYALMAVPGTTKGVIANMDGILPTDGSWAPTPVLTHREDSIIYEVSVRDFTFDESSGVDAAKRGKFMGMVQTGTTYGSVKTGIDHLKELGITHVQMLPTYDFATAHYNWGYDPANYNVPEEQYSQTTDPEGRIREFKDLINEYHKNGLRVVLDVVYNHTFEKSVLVGISGKYYTTVDLSGCGNSLNTGVPMVSRMMRDSLEQWVKNYNVDGFRFDLIGVYHYNEVKAWGEYLNTKYADRNLLMYGEPWNGYATDPEDSQKVRMGKVPALASAHVGVFNGKYREDIKGNNDGTVLAYMANGAISWWGAVAAGSRGSLTASKSTAILANDWDSMFAYDPEQTINYISAHDNYDLWDKIIHSGLTGGAGGYAGRVDMFGMGMVFTSQGIPFIHAGDEFLRTKAVNNIWTYAHNSYNAPDEYNKIRWADKVTNASVNNYYTAAIALRKASAGLRLTSWDEIKAKVTTKLNAGANSATGINCVNDASLPAKVVVNEIDSDGVGGTDLVVVFNPGNNFTVSLPAGTWKKVLDASGSVSTTDALCEGTAVTVFQKQ